MTASARVLAQAKINLLLHVIAREASGYHSIETLFLRLDWGDDVRVRVASGRSLECAGSVIPPSGLGPVEKNLAYRAAVAYADATGWPAEARTPAPCFVRSTHYRRARSARNSSKSRRRSAPTSHSCRSRARWRSRGVAANGYSPCIRSNRVRSCS